MFCCNSQWNIVKQTAEIHMYIFGKTQKESSDLRSAEAIIAAIPGKP